MRTRNQRERRNSIPEREIDAEDTENAVVQVYFVIFSKGSIVEFDFRQKLFPSTGCQVIHGRLYLVTCKQ